MHHLVAHRGAYHDGLIDYDEHPKRSDSPYGKGQCLKQDQHCTKEINVTEFVVIAYPANHGGQCGNCQSQRHQHIDCVWIYRAGPCYELRPGGRS